MPNKIIYLKNKFIHRVLESAFSAITQLNSTKKTCLVYGNCQARPISRLLAANNSFSRKYRIINFKPVHQVTKQDIPYLIKLCKQVDLFIYQPVKHEYKGLYELSTNFLISLLKKNALIISFHSLFFDAYSPEIRYIRSKNAVYSGPFNDYHNKSIIDMFIKGENINNTYNLLLNQNAYDSNHIISKYNIAIDELYRRESISSIDIKIASYIERSFKSLRLFWTFNHPSNNLLMYCTSGILKHLCIPERRDLLLQRLLRSELLGGYYFSIHPSVYKTLKLRFDNKQLFCINNKYISIHHAIKLFFNYYDKHPEVVEAYLKQNE